MTEASILEGLEEHFNEPVLEDNYAVHAGYLYVVDGKVRSSEVSGTVRTLKAYLKASEVRRCGISKRHLWEYVA